MFGFGLLQAPTIAKQVNKSLLVRTTGALTIPLADTHWAPEQRKAVLAPRALVNLLWAPTYQLSCLHAP